MYVSFRNVIYCTYFLPDFALFLSYSRVNVNLTRIGGNNKLTSFSFLPSDLTLSSTFMSCVTCSKCTLIFYLHRIYASLSYGVSGRQRYSLAAFRFLGSCASVEQLQSYMVTLHILTLVLSLAFMIYFN